MHLVVHVKLLSEVQRENNPKCCVGENINFNGTETSLTQLSLVVHMIICET